MPPAWRIDHNDLALLIGQVKEGMRQIGWEISKPPFIEAENFIPDSDFELAFQHMNRFLLPMVDMQRWPPKWCNFHYKIVKRPIRILAGNFKNKITARAGLEP